MHSLWKIGTVIPKEQYKYCVLLFIAMIIGAILEAMGIGAILPLLSIMGDVDYLSSHETLRQFFSEYGITSHTQFVIISASFLIVIYLLKNGFIAVEMYCQIQFSVRNQIFYSKQLLAEYLAKPYLFHINQNTAKLLRNVTSGGIVVFSWMLIPVLNLLTECVTAFTIWLMLVVMDPFIAILVAGFLGILLLSIIKMFRKKIAQQGVIQRDFQTKYLKWVNQSLGAVKETKVMHKETFFLERFDESYRFFGRAMGDFNFLNQMPRLMIESVVISGILLLIIIKITFGQSPRDIVPILGVLSLAAFRLMPSANRIVSLYNGIKLQMPFFHELYPELRAIRNRSMQGNLDIMPRRTEKMPFHKEICVNHLAFSYTEEKEILKDVNFSIPRGKFIGIIGSSGAGKTTFVDILLGLLNPSDGCISADGKDISENIRGWQENLAYVPQNIYLIDGSIKENIALGETAENIDDKRLEKALHMAELYDFVETLPKKTGTMVGERGVKLSGGQRQRIGIARALYQEPDVLILDEATSALDNETEKSITDTILKLRGKMTIIAIAHRISTLEECDFKVRFYDGVCEII